MSVKLEVELIFAREIYVYHSQHYTNTDWCLWREGNIAQLHEINAVNLRRHP